MKMLNLYRLISILMLLQDLSGPLMSPKVLMLGSRTIPSGRHPSRHVCFYTKKYRTNIEFEKIMSDPRISLYIKIFLFKK